MLCWCRGSEVRPVGDHRNSTVKLCRCYLASSGFPDEVMCECTLTQIGGNIVHVDGDKVAGDLTERTDVWRR